MTRKKIFADYHTRDQAKRAIITHLIQRTVGVINQVRVVGKHFVTGRAGDSEETGTGCVVKWGRRLLVVTAGHVVKTISSPTDIRIAALHQPMNFKSADRVTLTDTEAGTQLDLNSEVRFCAWEDLAAITLPESTFEECEYAEMRDEWADPPEGAMVGSIGFPVDNNVTVERKMIGDKEEVGLGLMPVLLDTDVLPHPSEDDLKFKTPDHDESRHFLVSYTSVLSQQPHGMSGAAVWLPDIKGIVWSPKFVFAGTCISVYMKGYSHHRGPVVQVVKASVVRRFLEEEFGNPF